MRENHIGIQVSTDEFLIRVEFPNPTSFKFKQPTTQVSLIIITNISQSKRERDGYWKSLRSERTASSFNQRGAMCVRALVIRLHCNSHQFS